MHTVNILNKEAMTGKVCLNFNNKLLNLSYLNFLHLYEGYPESKDRKAIIFF
jgi:hypothetical protein